MVENGRISFDVLKLKKNYEKKTTIVCFISDRFSATKEGDNYDGGFFFWWMESFMHIRMRGWHIPMSPAALPPSL